MEVTNRHAFQDYAIEEKYEAGIKLTGAEVKSVKEGKIILTGSYVKIVGNEVLLINATISPYKFSSYQNEDPKRTRKLLLHKKEILKIQTRLARTSLTIVPLKCYTTHGLVKLEIALARGKKQYEKREELRKKAVQREVERIVRGKI